MSEKRYSLKKYGDYPVILDGEKELTLDSVVELLNKKDFDDKLFTKEWNAVCRKNSYLSERIRKDNSRFHNIIKIMGLIVIIEFILIMVI